VTAVSTVPRPAPNYCRVLEEDAELGEAIDPKVRAHALETVLAREIHVNVGVWRPLPTGYEHDLGMLVLDGVLIHRIGVDRRFGIELIGEGDLLRPPPWNGESTLKLTNDWLILEPTRLAVLDERFVRQLAQFPELGGRLVSRAVQRSRQLAVNMAIVHQARVDVRLHAERGPFVVDVNPNSDLSTDAGLARAAKRAGLDYTELVSNIARMALARAGVPPQKCSAFPGTPDVASPA